MRFHLVSLSIFLPLIIFGQVKYDYVWLNGTDGAHDADPSTPGYENVGINMLNFNNGELNITRDYRDSDFYLNNASISSADGELLFYTNGCKVFQADGQVMKNGKGLNPGVAYDLGQCPDDGNSVSNGSLILPLPESDGVFYIFHKSLDWGDLINVSIYDAILYTTVVDMSKHGGLGEVLVKNDTIIYDTLFNDLHAVRHANGLDWWVMTSDGINNTYHKVLLTSDGVSGVFEQSIGPPTDIRRNGMSCFSPDGKMFARYDYTAQIRLFDFDRETGELSNFRHLTADTIYNNHLGYSIAFSPSSRFLYVGSLRQLYQFDLEAADIQDSQVFLAEYDGHEYLNTFPSDFGFMRLAPDCKIYMSSRSATPMYHVIHHPDRKGLECGFVQRGLSLPAYNIAAIPNFPNYRLGTGYPVCDSTIQLVVSSVQVPPPVQEVLVYPNPASTEVSVELPVPLTDDAQWSLYDAVGARVLSGKLAKGQRLYQIDIQGVPSGLYFWEAKGNVGRFGGGKLIVLK